LIQGFDNTGSSGTASHATRNEIASTDAIVNDKALKKLPLTPDKKAKGIWVMMVAPDEAASGLLNSLAARWMRSR